MYEINLENSQSNENLESLSIFVGSSKCNANCSHCAALPLRKYAPKKDGIINEELITKTLKNCFYQGASYLSITSSGEPTLSPISITKTLILVDKLKDNEIFYSPINLYSNGIRIGNEKHFCDKYLDLWKNLGLSTIYVTVHSTDEKKNAQIYRVRNYPSLEEIFSRIHNAHLKVRANIILSKKTIDGANDFIKMASQLVYLGVDDISAWPLRDLNDKMDLFSSPQESELDKIGKWIQENHYPNHIIRLLREEAKIKYSLGKKLTLFPDGTLSSNWCR